MDTLSSNLLHPCLVSEPGLARLSDLQDFSVLPSNPYSASKRRRKTEPETQNPQKNLS